MQRTGEKIGRSVTASPFAHSENVNWGREPKTRASDDDVSSNHDRSSQRHAGKAVALLNKFKPPLEERLPATHSDGETLLPNVSFDSTGVRTLETFNSRAGTEGFGRPNRAVVDVSAAAKRLAQAAAAPIVMSAAW